MIRKYSLAIYTEGKDKNFTQSFHFYTNGEKSPQTSLDGEGACALALTAIANELAEFNELKREKACHEEKGKPSLKDVAVLIKSTLARL